MTKRDLVIRISNETGLVQQQVLDIVQRTLDYIAEAVAKGEAEMALFISNLLVSVPGVDYVGPVPAEFQQILVFSAAAGAKSKDAAAATAFVQHLTTPAAKAAVKANGMDLP